MIGSPLTLSETLPQAGSAPLVGQHSPEVLAGLGYTAPQITNLSREGVSGHVVG